MNRRSFLPSASALLAMVVAWVGVLGGQTLDIEILAEFERPGRQPLGALVRHSDGGFYGTTVAGGAWDRGTVFRITGSGDRSLLHSFHPDEGVAPVAGLIEGPDGNLMGTTSEGGLFGFGTLFRLSPDGAYSVIVHFSGISGDALGSVPGSLHLHSDGFVYGTTAAGGTDGWGTVFRLGPDDEFTTLVSFTGESGARPGSEPLGPLAARNDRFYGVTRTGGATGNGGLFSLTLSGDFAESHAFSGDDGSGPAGGPVPGADGFWYGTTEFGGQNGVGVLYRFDPTVADSLEVVHHFSDSSGSQPVGSLAVASSGILYGVTSVGGEAGWGGLFKLEPGGAYQLLVSFSGAAGASPGASPRSGLTATSDGGFIGATSAGGADQRGVVFRLTTAGDYLQLADFSSATGWAPSGSVVTDSGNRMFLAMAQGGEEGLGVISSVLTDGTIVPVQSFSAASGGQPTGPLTRTPDGWLAVNQAGGAFDRGSVALVAPPAEPGAVNSFTSLAGEGFSGPLAVIAGGGYYGVSERLGFGGQGAVWRFDPTGGFQRIIVFTGISGARPGSRPRAPLVVGPDGNLYGVTEAGGSFDQGVLFRVDPDGTYRLLAEFETSGPRRPGGGLSVTPDGRIFGTTSLGGGADAGTVFEWIPADGSWVVRAEFTGADGSAPGARPIGPMSVGASGSLYGLTLGMAGEAGTAFVFSPETGLESLFRFTGMEWGFPGIVLSRPDAQLEWLGGLNEGPDGLVYGAVPAGGSGGGGVVFRIRRSTDLAAWKLELLGDGNAPDLGDPDRDGMSNLLEYALQRSPVDPDPEGLEPQWVAVGGEIRLGMTVFRDPARSDISLIVESAASPAGPWEPVATSVAGAPFSGSAGVVETPAEAGIVMARIVESLPSSPDSPRFMRLRVTH